MLRYFLFHNCYVVTFNCSANPITCQIAPGDALIWTLGGESAINTYPMYVFAVTSTTVEALLPLGLMTSAPNVLPAKVELISTGDYYGTSGLGTDGWVRREP